jgi:hypothetical protein
MDMDRPPYRSLYSATLFQVMTPISVATQYWPCQLDRGPIDCALPRNTGIFHNTILNRSFLLKELSCIPHTRYLVAATNDVAASHSSFRRNNHHITKVYLMRIYQTFRLIKIHLRETQFTRSIIGLPTSLYFSANLFI